MAEHNDFGHQGEVLAQNLLTQKGYKIIDTNWRYGHNEVDIIAQKDDIIVFVEVKTRSTTVFGEPESFVTREKQKAYIRLANHYIELKPLQTEIFKGMDESYAKNVLNK